MTDQQISDLTAILGAAVATGDELVIVDVSDTTMASTGTTKKITADEVAKFIAANTHVTAAFDAVGVAAALVDDLSGVTNAATARTNLGLGTAATHAATDFDTAGAASTAQSTAETYADAAVTTHTGATDPHGDRAYADGLFAANDALIYKGAIDCSTNPNYPAASAGHVYKVSVAGKIGGASGTNVEVGDSLLCTVDNSSAGTQAAVGANWNIIQANLDGAVIGPASSTSGNLPTFSGTGGKLLQDSGTALTSLAPKASPALTGTPTAPTQTASDNSTKIATTAYADGSSSTAAAAKVSDTAYDASSWDAVTTVAPSKNAVRDKIELLAPLASPVLTGNPTAPTASVGDNDTSIATTAYVHGEIGSSIQAFDSHYLKSNTSVQLTAGFDATDHAYGTISSGTVTPVPSSDGSNFGTLTNNGAFTLAVPTNSTSVVIEVTNGASAGTITTSGYTKVNGDSYDTTSAHKFIFWITKAGSSSVLTIKALQ